MAVTETPSKFKNFFSKLESIKLSEKIFFVQQLGIMIKTGISLAVALRTLAEQTSSKRFKRILQDLQAQVEKGSLLSKSLEKYQRTFGELFINMVAAGEESGKLEDVLNQLFIQMKKDHDIVSKVRGAMIYPAVVVVMMVVIGTAMMVYVVPNIAGVFKELNVELPLPTRILIFISDGLLNYGLYLVVALAVIITALSMYFRTPNGKKVLHTLILRTPIMGGIVKKINLARFCRTLSSLLKTDIPIVQSFEITSRILGNVIYRKALIEAKEHLKKGISIKQSLDGYKEFFPPVVLQMIAVGEETGALDDILEESAIFYEEDVDQIMNDLPSLIEPLLITVLGVGVGGMAVAVIMPLYSISEAI